MWWWLGLEQGLKQSKGRSISERLKNSLASVMLRNNLKFPKTSNMHHNINVL